MIYDTGKQWRVMAMGGEAVEAVVKYSKTVQTHLKVNENNKNLSGVFNLFLL